jgi:hypothetical protein
MTYELSPEPPKPRRPEDEPLNEDAREVDIDALPRCPECGYILHGLGKMRCPECGVSVRFEDINVSHARRRADEERNVDLRKTWVGVSMAVIGAGLFLGATWDTRVAIRCFSIPLVGLTVLVLIYRLVNSDPLPPAWVWIGVLWITGGSIVAAMKWL